MPRTSVKKITSGHIETALDDVGQAEYEIRDVSCPGLSIRVRARTATWILRGRLGPKQSTWTVGRVAANDDPADIRRRVIEARNLLERGIDPTDELRRANLGGEVERHFDPARDGLTWEEARDKYLDKVKVENAPKTYIDYRQALNSAYLKRFVGRLVKTITADDLRLIQTEIAEAGHKTQAAHITRILKTALGWIATSGHAPGMANPAAGVVVIKKTKTELAHAFERQKELLPSEEELGQLPWRLDRKDLNKEARLGAMMALLTVQRRETIVTARIEHFIRLDSGLIWSIPPLFMKSKRPHVVPIYGLAERVVERAIQRADANEGWLFPQQKLRRAEDEGGGHMAGKNLSEVMEKVGSAVRPHGCRRAFGTYGESLLGFGRSDTKAILDHAEGESQDVTAQHYALHNGEHFKWRVMKKWEGFIVQLIHHHSFVDMVEPELPFFLR